MKLRAAASLALALAAVTGLAGCNLISPQRTTMEYDASDGVGVSVGDVEIRNAILLVDPTSPTESPDTANFIFGLVNHSGEAGTLTVTVGEGAEQATATIDYPADETLVKVGYGDEGQFLLTGAPLAPGSAVQVTFTASSGSTVQANVPVLDGAIEPYGSYLPTPGATEPEPGATEPGTTPAPEEGAQP